MTAHLHQIFMVTMVPVSAVVLIQANTVQWLTQAILKVDTPDMMTLMSMGIHYLPIIAIQVVEGIIARVLAGDSRIRGGQTMILLLTMTVMLEGWEDALIPLKEFMWETLWRDRGNGKNVLPRVSKTVWPYKYYPTLAFV
ncbi:hypothetical protein DEU56DRAFT_752869 [Suillus clintonianus]|uniref:uncharacterized protein n=1 Tax=Suillus clintonianus TaxID=1904413 RepID=UPI001B85BF3E|nr:uncharacterized protein DEU56DRAFT_752869 [Suillus clintonianus]KAG2149216.1 hypothetical protein DEU56DRAFT_752869 [Suillus clintonianus]